MTLVIPTKSYNPLIILCGCIHKTIEKTVVVIVNGYLQTIDYILGNIFDKCNYILIH